MTDEETALFARMRDDLECAQAALDETEAVLDDKKAENERLGSQVTNLELDVRRRDEWVAARDAYIAELVAARDKLAHEVYDLQGLLLASASTSAPAATGRERLPDDRLGKTFKLRIGVDEKLCDKCKVPLPGSRVSGHLTLNRYPDGRLGEMFLALDRGRRGDLAATFAHQFAIMVSIALQYGVPPKVIIDRLRHVRDESGGYIIREVDGKLVPEEHGVGSIIDLIALRMEQFCQEDSHG